jgi:hypothetical protein
MHQLQTASELIGEDMDMDKKKRSDPGSLLFAKSIKVNLITSSS